MKRILVIGDAITDVYRDFEYKKKCPDSPSTPVGILVGYETRPGGAANVALNLSALAPRDTAIDLMAVLDMETYKKVKLIGDSRINMDDSAVVDDESSLRKERITMRYDVSSDWFVSRLDNRQTVNRLTVEDIERSLYRYLKNENCQPDMIILSDYAGGILTMRVLDLLLQFKDKLLIDTKVTDLSIFSGSLLAKLNESEFERACHATEHPEKYFDSFVVTNGNMGATLMTHERLEFPACVVSSYTKSEFPAINVPTVDVCGCGDTFMAGLAAGLIRYDDIFAAIPFANAAAATVVSQQRTAVADLQKTLEMVRGLV